MNIFKSLLRPRPVSLPPIVPLAVLLALAAWGWHASDLRFDWNWPPKLSFVDLAQAKFNANKLLLFQGVKDDQPSFWSLHAAGPGDDPERPFDRLVEFDRQEMLMELLPTDARQWMFGRDLRDLGRLMGGVRLELGKLLEDDRLVTYGGKAVPVPANQQAEIEEMRRTFRE